MKRDKHATNVIRLAAGIKPPPSPYYALDKTLENRIYESIYGYNIEELVAVAELLRLHHIEESDLKCLRDNFELAYRVVREESEQAINDALSVIKRKAGGDAT